MVTTYTYYAQGEQPADNKGYLKEVKVKYRDASPTELITTYTHTSFGGMSKIVDPLGRETTFVVDHEFLLRTKTSPGSFSIITRYSYNGNRQLVLEELENVEGETRIQGNPWWETKTYVNDAGRVLSRKREIELLRRTPGILAGGEPWLRRRIPADQYDRSELERGRIRARSAGQVTTVTKRARAARPRASSPVL
jgi:hypothetical protein